MKHIIDRPVLASIFFIIIIIFGFYSYQHMPIELVPDPEGGLPQLNVTYNWRGASPDMILQKVLIPAEEEIMHIKGVEKMFTRAMQGYGYIEVEFTRDTRMNFANVQLRERLNRLTRDFPPQVTGPEIQPRIPDEFQQEPMFKIGIYGENYSIYTLRKMAEREVLPYLKAIPGIESVGLFGGVDPEIKIQTNLDRLERFDVDVRDIQIQLYRNFYTRQSLSLTRNSGEITLALSENPEKIEEIQNIVVRSLGEKKVYLKDVAEVYLGYEKLQFERRYQGRSYVQFEMWKEPDYSHLQVANQVKEKLQYLANKLKGRAEFVLQADDSKELRSQLEKLGKIAFLILIIIFVILLVIIRDIKSSLLIFSSVFFSVFATLTVIYLFKISLNLLTLSGLALGFGLFVDNAVVVFDSILRFRERGHDLKESAAEGAKAVILPVLASTFTTIIVFFSFALLFKDRLRVYYLPLAYIIAISLISSVVVSFVLIPSLSARIKIKLKKRQSKELFKKGKFFPFVLKYPLLVILPIIILFYSSYHTFLEEVSFGRFFSWYSQERIAVRLLFRSGTEFEEIQKAILGFEKLALEKPYKKEINTTIWPGGAWMTITFPPEVEATGFPLQLKQELVGLATNLAGVGVYVAGFDQEPYYYNPDTGSHLPFNIHISGYNYEKLMEFTGKFKRNLLKHRRIKEAEVQTDMRFWWGAKDKYYSFKMNREKLKRYNLRPGYLLFLVGTVLQENTRAYRVRYNDRDLYVEIKAADVDKLELDDILNKYLESPQGVRFRVKDVVDIEFNTQKGGITRENQEYKAMVQWDYLGSAKAGDRFFRTVYDKLQVPVGFKKSQEERRFRISEEEEEQLNLAIILSIALILLLLGMLYESFLQPFLIILAVPLALIGVFIAFVLWDFSFDSTGYIGVILLSGIVVNNAILLIDNINRHVRQSGKIVESIAIATKERIRPIFMTSMTTVLGMLPLVLLREATASQSDIWSSLALCIVGGLTSSAILILLVLPIFYYLLHRLQKFIRSQFKRQPAKIETT
ncbi:MAG: efflux RND transporter permease subunit [Candidatus Aminicenantes bacterium]|jgi:HAE1 family hydrophobic/amphiphilic exporter-1